MASPALRRRFNEQFYGPQAAQTIEGFAKNLPQEASIKRYIIEYHNGVVHSGSRLEEACSNLRKYHAPTKFLCRWDIGEQQVASLEFDWIVCAVRAQAYPDCNPQNASAAILSLESIPLPAQMDLLSLRAQFVQEISAAQQQNVLAKAETDAALLSIRTQLREATLQRYAQIFSEESHAHGNLARKWLIATGGSALCALAYTIWAGFGTTMDLLVVLLRHIFLLSVPATAFAVAVRMYRSEKHNQILWAHKSRALQAYQAFVEDTKALDDRMSREAMLMHVMGLVFSAQDTGYGAPGTHESNIADAIIAMKKLSS